MKNKESEQENIDQYKEYQNINDKRILAFRSYDWQQFYKLMNDDRRLLGTKVSIDEIEQNNQWKRIY